MNRSFVFIVSREAYGVLMTLIIPSYVASVMTADVRRWLPDVSRSSPLIAQLNLHTADFCSLLQSASG